MLRTLRCFLVTAALLLLAILSDNKAAATPNNVFEPNLHLIRKQLIDAVNSGKVTDSLYNSLNALKTKSPLITGYIGTLKALKAKHTWNPYYKVKYLKDAEKSFKNAVTNDPHNIEIRFMRFSVEHNVPGFLGYNKNLVADREEIIRQLQNKHYSSADMQLVKTIITFLVNSKRCTTAENHLLTQQLAAL